MSSREVTLVGGSPWGFRMHGGHDLHQPLRISRVNPGSKAAQQGVREGDLISSINGRNTRDLTNSEAHTLLRNAGDQLKLGLNQESAGSPKRRIYKSSLQENTSIETIQKITKTTKTSATRVLSSEEREKRNGADDTRDERDFTSQNGNLNRNETAKCVTDETTNKIPQPSNIALNPKKLQQTSRMPQSSRSRRNRRNRNKASAKSKNRTEVTEELPSASSPEKYSPKPEDVKKADGKIRKDDVDGIIEAKVNGQAVKVTTEVVETPGHEIGSISKQRETVKRRYKLQRHALNSQPKICEVTTISDLPMEAHIGHVPGVGIVESSINDCDDIRTIVTEPVEPIGPLSSDVTSRVKSLGERDFALALLPATGNANKNGPEIHEVTDSDVETTEFSKPDIISEVESDIEISKKNETILEETEESDSTDKHASENGNMDQYENLETSVDRCSNTAIIIEPESDQTIFEETEESDSTDKETTLPPPKINKPENNHSTSAIKVKQTSTSEDTNTDGITIDLQEIEMAVEDKIKEQKPLHNVTVSKESSKCTVDSNEKTMQVKSKEFTSASSVIVIEEDIQQPPEIYEPLFPQQFQDKVRFFIEECDLVSEKENDYGNLLNDKCHEKYETCNTLQRHLKRVETQENCNFDTGKDRYLDIIHEEGEKPVCHEEKHIRDFINEEIGKFRREKRKIDVDEGIIETGNNEFDFCHVTMKSTERKGSLFDADEGKTYVAMNQVNEEESELPAPLPPRRSSSFHNKEEKAHYEKPKIPDLPNEVIKSIRKNNDEFLDLCPPLRPPLPDFNEKDDIISRNDEQNEGVFQIHITPKLRNSIEDAGKFGNDDTTPKSTKIESKRIDNIASEVPVKNTWALKESTPICTATMLNNVEVKCPRPQESQFTETKEEKVIILETLKRECIETTEVTSSNVVEIKETQGNLKKSADVLSSSANEELKVETKSEKFEKIEETAESQDSSSSNASPVTVKFVPEDETYDGEPNHLSDLCVRKILSMPYGSQLIKEISHPKFNIFKNLEPIHKTVKNLDNQKSENSETMKKRPHTWMGVPTSEDPHLLVCLSPSQQEANVVTSADKLLDLHEKFLNRRSYHSNRKSEINVPKYHIELPSKKSTAEPMKIEKKEMEQSQPSNRLLEIIKENPIREDLPLPRKSHKDVEQNRLKSTQLTNWLTSPNNDEVNSSMCKSSQSCNFSSEQVRYQENEKTRESAFSPVHRRNGNIKANDSEDIRSKRQGKIFEDTNKFNETANRINSALILRTPDGVQEHRSSTLINKTPITSKSAIIDRTCEVTEPRKRTLSRTIDSRHVNPALINYKPEAPPRCRRTVEVDRACIDTTSIFDKSPARGHLESRIYQDPEDLKQATATEIIGNLKQLQKGVRGMADGRERYSLPQEYFDRQFEYIEKLEDQLKEVILAEEEEKKAFEEYEGQVKRINDEHHQNESPKTSNNSRQTWHEETNIDEKNRKESTSKEGHQECKKSVIQVPGHRMENSMEEFVNKEKTKVTSESEKVGPEWAKFFDDISRDSRDVQEKRDNYRIHEKSERPKSISVLSSSDEVFRRKMYDEYVHKVTEREERKHHKVIKISSHMDLDKRDKYKDNMSTMEKEFIEKAKNRLSRFGIQLDEGENQSMREETNETHLCEVEKNVENEEAKCIIDGKEIRDAKKLPKHLQEFLKLAISELEDENMFSPTFKASSAKPGVWSPSSEPPPPPRQPSPDRGKNTDRDAGGIPPVWTPSSAGPSPVVERKEFRPVSFESPILSRKHKPQAQLQSSTEEIPPWKNEDEKRESSQHITQNITTRIVNSHSVPSQGLNTLANAPRLPRAQNPTITLLQKAREGQLPKGAAYLEENEGEKSHERAAISPGEIIYTIKREYESEAESDKDKHKKMADLGPRKVLGIGPITRDGMPVALRSEIRETNQAKWYKQMYDSLHRAGRDDDYETIRYKPRRGARYGYASASGYLSEPEPRISVDRSVTLDTRRRQRNKENDTATSTMPRKSALVKTTAEVYRNQPGRIENYQPGRSSISEKETKEPFDQRNPHAAKPYMSHALKESGYESDSTLIFRRRDDVSPLSPLEQRLAYKTVQKGGDVPLHGFRKPAPERPKESPRRYVEGEVTIHYRSPVRTETKEILSEEELARKSAENMRRVYQEERRRKYLQELHDIDSRRHTDNFTPSQKSPIPLNRYDDFIDDLSYRSRSQEHTPEPRLVARALYNFVGQTTRELSFRRGDIILIRRQIDKNWYEGEHNAMIGLFPLNYVEILPYDGSRGTPKKSYEGQARAKFNFIAQTNLELSLGKGELVVLTRRVDENWFEGRIGNKKGIFPVTYVEVILEPGQHRPETPVSSKPVASPAAHSMLSNGTASGKMSMGPHHYTPSIPVKTSTAEPQYISLPRIGVTERNKLHVAPVNETLHIDTHSDTIPYRALYNYRPQNEDELELKEGDTVYVMEKCDDGWFVGSSQRTGYFGTFPGNYVERL